MFQPQPSAHGATAQRESGEAYVFRDFERSRIMAIRRAVAADPALYSFWFFAVVAVWTVLMSAGAGMHGQNLPAVNVTPHIAHFTIILGFFFYPLRLIWVPVLAYLRDTQNYVHLAARGLTLWDVAPGRVEREIAQHPIGPRTQGIFDNRRRQGPCTDQRKMQRIGGSIECL